MTAPYGVWNDPEFGKAVWLSDDGNHRYVPVDHDGEWVGINEFHRHPTTGQPCGGWVPFTGSSLDTGSGWTVESRDPLTLSPSLLCTVCNNHGFIRAGRWVDA